MTDKTWEELKAMEPVKDHDGHIKDWLTKLYAAGDALKEKADRLDELLVIYKRHYGNVIEYAIELQEKAEKYDAHEWITKETPDGEVLELYHLDDLATAHDDKREAERKLEDTKTVLDEDWDDFNAAYEQDSKLKRHPRWKLKEILEEQK